MRRLNIIVLILLFLGVNTYSQKPKAVNTTDIVKLAFEKGQKHLDISTYPGTLMLHGMSEFGLLKGNNESLQQVITVLQKFGAGETVAKGNFISYEAGGTGSAYLSWLRATDKLDAQVLMTAEKMMSKQQRSTDGLMTIKGYTNKIFIDVCFAVTPFLLYSGLKFKKQEWIDYAVFQTLESFRILRDTKTGLLHQGRGFYVENQLSEDNWSRGNGWGAYALALLVRDLPVSHPKYAEVTTLAKDYFTAVIKHQNKNGLWHQEMTDTSSFVETSGSGILLYSLGIMIEKKVLPRSYMKNFKKGISAYLDYIDEDGSVRNTSYGLLCPGNGTKEVYKNWSWELNDYHAFGPVVLAYTQALKMGIKKVKPLGVNIK